MGSENRADHAWDFLSSWFVISGGFYRAGGGTPFRRLAFLFAPRLNGEPNGKVRLLTFVAIHFATRCVAQKKRVLFCPLPQLPLFS
jgi:hypothetical protein